MWNSCCSRNPPTAVDRGLAVDKPMARRENRGGSSPSTTGCAERLLPDRCCAHSYPPPWITGCAHRLPLSNDGANAEPRPHEPTTGAATALSAALHAPTHAVPTPRANTGTSVAIHALPLRCAERRPPLPRHRRDSGPVAIALPRIGPVRRVGCTAGHHHQVEPVSVLSSAWPS